MIIKSFVLNIRIIILCCNYMIDMTSIYNLQKRWLKFSELGALYISNKLKVDILKTNPLKNHTFCYLLTNIITFSVISYQISSI